MAGRFPYPDDIAVGGEQFSPEEVIERLTPYLSDRRRERIDHVVRSRTYSVVPVLEGVHDLGNVNAVMRSAEGLGYGAAHLVDLQGDAADWAQNKEPSAITGGLRAARRQSQGADKWLDLHVWDDVPSAAIFLRSAGYRIAVTHLGGNALPIEDVDFTIPTAIVLGNEAQGVSESMLGEADLNLFIPIDGFIQSYNVSVAAALALYHARADRIARRGGHSDLTDHEQTVLTAIYYLKATRHAEALLNV